MTRIAILAVLAGSIAVVVGSLVLSGAGQPQVTPTVAPSLVAPSTTPAASLGVMPDVFLGGWISASRGTSIENLPSGDESALGGSAEVTTIAFMESADFGLGPAFWLDRRGTPLLQSSVSEESPGVVRFTMRTTADTDCVANDSGTYRWTVSSDGQWITLEMIEDACETRGRILPGTWQRSLAHDSPGGAGISAAFKPFVTFTLPEDSYKGWGLGGRDEMIVDREDGAMSFKIWKELDGFVDPCDRTKGRLSIDPGMDAFLGYLREDPRFTVTNEEEFEIDGHRAVQVDFQLGANLSEPCHEFDGDPNNRSGVLLWAPAAEPNPDYFWNGELDTPGTIVVTEVDGTMLALEAVLVEPNGDFRTDRELLDTVRFLEALPSPPAS